MAETDGAVVTDTTFVRLGGLAAITAMVLLFAGIYTHIGPAGAPSPPDGMDVYLTIINDNPAANALSGGLQASAYLVLLVFLVALYRLFRGLGPVMRLALIAGTVGLVFLTASRILSITEVELAAQYVGTEGPTRAAVAAMTETLLRMKAVLDLFGNVLAWGVGGLLFSLAILRTSVLSRWLGYGGILYGAGIWLAAIEVVLTPGVSSRDSIIFVIAVWYGIVWVFVMGIALLRIDEASVA